MAGPDVTRSSYDGARTVIADWSGILDELVPSYHVTVFDGQNQLKSGNGAGQSGTVTLDQPLDPGSLQYTVAVAPGQSGNAYGDSLPVIAGRLTHLAATWVGGTELQVSWTLPNSLPNGAQLRVVDGNNTSYGNSWLPGSSGVLTLNQPLDPAGSYTLYGAAAFRESGPEFALRQATGPEVSLPLVAEALPLVSVVYDRNRLVLALRLSAAAPGGVQPGAVLSADGAQQVRYYGDAGQQEFSIQLKAPLDPAVHYTVQPFLRAGDADGPFGPAVTVLVSAPAVTSVGWSGDNLEVAWAPLAGPPWPTGGALEFTGPGNHPGPVRIAEAASWSGVPNPPFDPRESAPYLVTAANTRGVATGPMGAGLAVIVDAVHLLTASYDGAVLQASWTNGSWPGATGARLLVLAGDTVVAAVDAGLAEAGATVPVQLAAGQDYTAALQWTGDRSTGPIGPRTAPLLTVPVVVTRVLTDPGTNLPTVYWPAMSVPAGLTYQLQLLRDGEPDGPPIPAPSASLTLGQPLLPGARQAVQVRAVLTVDGGTTLTGPFGPPLELPVGLPAIESVDYDGITALVRWQGVAGATGYAVDIVVDQTGDRAGQAEAGTAEREARVTVTPTPDPGQSWTVVVRALAGLSSGPRAVAPLVVPALRPALDEVDTTPLPRLFRTSSLATGPQPITAYLPPLGITAASVPANPPAAAPFVITRNPDPATSGAFPYTLTIGGAALSFAAADRAAVRTSYLALLKEAEALTPAMTPRSVHIVRDAIARLLPQTFTETLYYGYGLSNPGSAVDLRPGTILRVGSPPFQTIPGSKAGDYLTGYAAGPATDFEIDDYVAGTSWLTGFDAFLSWLVSNDNLIVRDPAHSADWSVVSGAADPADLYFTTMRRPFYRLFFPQFLLNTTDPALNQPARQFALLGADTFTAISSATPNPVPANVRAMLFRGRSVLRVCIRVRVDGANLVVPVGTTVGNLLDRLGRRPPGSPPALRGLTLERSLGAAVLDPSCYDTGAGQPVQLGWRGAGYAAGGDPLSLPLLPGDRLSTGDLQ